MANTIYTARPTALVLNSGGKWTAQPSGTLYGVTSDNSDSSSARLTSFPGTGLWTLLLLIFDSGGFTALPALAQIRSVTPRARMKTDTYLGYRFGFNFAGLNGSYDSIASPADGAIRTLTGTTRTTRADGANWNDVGLAGLQFETDYNGLLDQQVDLYEAYIDIAYNQAPVADVTAPTGAVTTTSQPTVAWTYSDPESDVQERYRVKIFTAAQYGAGGFSPDSSTAAWDSGEVLSAATSVQTGPLANSTTYRAYVKVADVGSGGRYGAWDYIGFNIAVTAPPAPSLTGSADDALARVELVATHGSFGSAQTFVIEKSTDGGATWAVIRAADETPPSSGSTLTAYDYELPRGVEATYRAYTVAQVGGYRLVSPYSSTVGVALAQTGWWLKDPLFPELNMQPEVLPSFSIRRKEPQTVYEPLGRSTSLVVSDGVRGIEGTIEMWAKNAARYGRLEALISSGRALLLEDVLGRSWYIKFGTPSQWSIIRAVPTPDESTPIRHLHQVSVPFTEVSAPTGTPSTGTPTLDPPLIEGSGEGYSGGY